jgi:hypothetical protein
MPITHKSKPSLLRRYGFASGVGGVKHPTRNHILMIDVVKISEAEKNKLLAIDEGHFADLKAIEVAPGKLTKAIAAFANAEGGDLFMNHYRVKS